MGSIEKLEISVRKLMETGEQFRSERDTALADLEDIRGKLRETEERCERDIAAARADTGRTPAEMERVKKALIADIDHILAKLDALSLEKYFNIDKSIITNGEGTNSFQ